MRYFFGDTTQQVFPDRDREIWKREQSLLAIEPFAAIATATQCAELLFPHQVHGTVGIVADAHMAELPRSFTHDADWIVTNKPGLGIGILTADCVPFLLYDPVQHAVGAVHAGWRGAASGVVSAAITAMYTAFSTQPRDLRVFVGPYAKPCCYQVDQPFYEAMLKKPFGVTVWRKRKDQLFFDLYQCCFEQVQAQGVLESNITVAPSCTVCDLRYCSYRRDRDQAGRNISMIGLPF